MCRCLTPLILKSWRCRPSMRLSKPRRLSVTGDLMSANYDELQVPPGANQKGGIEVLRAGVVDGGLHVTLRRAFNDPKAWGILLADVARQVARVYAQEGDEAEDNVV